MSSSDPIKIVSERFPDAVTACHRYRGDDTILLDRNQLREVARFLKEAPDLKMNFLMDVTAVDYSAFGKAPQKAFFASSGVRVSPRRQPDKDPWPGPPEGARFAVVYHFYSLEHRHRLRILVPLDESDPEVDSLIPLWAGADWLEREVWDMFGIRFRDHPNLVRILMYDEFEGHPLRKDYPVNRRQPLVKRPVSR